MFKLHYRVSNNGDGSVSVDFSDDLEKITAEDDEANELGEGFAEPTVGTVNLRVTDGKIEYQDYDDVAFQRVWIPL